MTVYITAPRVKSPSELRPGHEILGCPSCNHDMWVSSAQLRQLEAKRTPVQLSCRNCASLTRL